LKELLGKQFALNENKHFKINLKFFFTQFECNVMTSIQKKIPSVFYQFNKPNCYTTNKNECQLEKEKTLWEILQLLNGSCRLF